MNNTEMSATNEPLRKTLHDRNLILDSVSDMLIFLDREFCLQWANPIAAETAGMQLEEMLGKHCYKIWCANDFPCENCRLQKVFDQREIHEHEAITPDGRIWRVKSSPICGDDGEIIGAIQVGVDISEVRQAEACLEETNLRLEAALSELQVSQDHLVQQERLAAVGQLAAGIAHDFSNVLGPIILYSEMVLESGRLSVRNKERLQTIIQQAHRGGNLTAQILDFSRQSVMERQVMDLKPFLNEFIKLLTRTLREHISIEMTADCEDCLVLADPARMQQICMNLALNARDAMPNGGSLTFELSRASYETSSASPLDEMQPGEWAVLHVRDTGEGIGPDILPKIFEPFFTTKPRGYGSGLGLPQVYGLVRQHGGFVNVSSEVGGGTIFTLYLPVQADRRGRYTREYTSQTIHGNGEKVLVVEDELVERMAVAEALESLGYRVGSAGNGQEALEILEREGDEIAMVISDLIMPQMGGVQLFRELERLYPGKGFLLMTGYPLRGEAKQLVESRFIRALQKPINLETISHEVSRALPK